MAVFHTPNASASHLPAPVRESSHGADRPPRRSPPYRNGHPLATIAVICMLAALVGAGALAATLWAIGAIHTGAPTTVYLRDEGGSGGAAGSGVAGTAKAVNAAKLYAAAEPGVVDVVARVSGESSWPGVAPEYGEGTQSGAGIVLDGHGYLLTAAHVIEDASSISVRLADGTVRSASLVGTDASSDLALLKVSPAGLTLHPLTLGGTSSLQVGDPVAAIGDPFGYARSLSTGVISGLHRQIEAPNGATISGAIQTDAALNPGNSGGPLLDAQGRVIAVVDQIVTDSADHDDSSGVGFAVPIETFQSRLQALIGS